VFTFFLHMVFMNLTLGGTLMAVVAHHLSGGRRDDPRGALAARLMAVNNYAISLTITTGVAPLLFIQVLYHQLFYPATILVGGVWFAFLGVLIVAYYAAYLYKFKGAPASGRGGGLWLALCALSFLVIATVHVAVHLVHVQVSTWQTVATNPWSVLADPTLVPRLLHFVLAGIGFSAAVAAWWAVRQAAAGAESDRNAAIACFAWKWVLWSTVLQAVDGVVLLLVLPQSVLLGLMRGGAATMLPLTAAIVLAIGLIVMVARVSDPTAAPRTVNGVLISMTAVVAVMSITRHQLRLLYIAPLAELTTLRELPQWLNFGLFVVLLAAGLATVGWMVHRVLSSPASGEEAA
jgi:hypothetical protein